ncbi:MAG: Peroxyureidoacrylate/ureidoacrylate amidohydrolase RutB [Alphaproteobacteria bacterium MarineAlpha2_Bin1]|nr:MAG: Peroxyureidoacrylate/ureidoacrylate amidohydrolase RutB [Alphaproteobacteria bacterium MarineAlpha2_Bin1]
MHKYIITDEVKKSAILRRGKLHPYENLIAKKTALVIIDMQNAFVEKGAGHAWIPNAASTCKNINLISDKIREKKGLVIWVLNTFEEKSLSEWSHFHEYLSSKETLKLRSQSMSENSYGHKLYKSLKTKKNDIFEKKFFYSAFIQGSSNINQILKKNKIENIIITGTATNVCCESSARDAMMLNYKTIMVSDACSASNDEQHTFSLNSFIINFGDVRTTDQILKIIN